MGHLCIRETLSRLSIVAFFCVFVFLSSSLAQNSDGLPVQEIENRVKKFKSSYRWKVKFDKFKDITIVARSFTVKRLNNIGSTGSIDLTIGFTFKGNTFRSRPEELVFHVRAWKSGGIFGPGRSVLGDSSQLIFLADEHRIDLGEGNRSVDYDNSWRLFFPNMSTTAEEILYRTTGDTLHKLSLAKKIEVQLGRFEFEINPDTKKGMKDIQLLLDSVP